MNRVIPSVVLVLVAAACGRAPEPGSAPLSSTSVAAATTATSADALTAGPTPTSVSTALSTTAVKPTRTTAPATTTARPPAVTSKPPPPPKPPDRWVLGAADRRSLEQQTGQPFPDFQVDDFYRRICPAHDVCLKNAFQVDPGIGRQDEDCVVGDHLIPDPLFEGGTVTWVVNNPCDPA
ncbi:hypothetical protein ACIA5G_23935 [Amycolatopsis sp. NPDC051758]|uniref:hypothetical protein n=1 Tax=Amycolatopsis sp. NPDC051758 TaxID=3363935 RepID=UPI0037B6112C